MFFKTGTAERVIGCAIEVHRVLGPGLLESAYHACLKREFSINSLPFKEQVRLPVLYKELRLDCGYRLDFVVNDDTVVEIKSVERILPVHKAQALTYLRLTGLPQALLINFYVPVLKHGISSIVFTPSRLV